MTPVYSPEVIASRVVVRVSARAVKSSSQVKATMLRLDSAFDETNYGCRSFCGFLDTLAHRSGLSADPVTTSRSA